MELSTVAACAVWTGTVWALGALSTWLAVRPLRRRVDGLEAWQRRKEGADEGFRREVAGYVAVCEEYFAADKAADEAGSKWREASDRQLQAQSSLLDRHEASVKAMQERVDGLEAVSEALKDNLWAVDAKLKAVAKAGQDRASAPDFPKTGMEKYL